METIKEKQEYEVIYYKLSEEEFNNIKEKCYKKGLADGGKQLAQIIVDDYEKYPYRMNIGGMCRWGTSVRNSMFDLVGRFPTRLNE